MKKTFTYNDMTAVECVKNQVKTYWKIMIIYICTLIFLSAIYIAERIFISPLTYGNDAALELHSGLSRIFFYYYFVSAIFCAIIFSLIGVVKYISFKEIYLAWGDPKKFIEAEELVQKKIPFWRTDRRRKCTIANAYLALGDYDNAWKCYEEIIPKNLSKCYNIHNMFGLACYYIAVDNHEEAAKYLARLEKVKATVAKKRKSLSVMIDYLKCTFAIHEGKYEEAKELMNSNIDGSILANQITCYNLKAECYYNLATIAYEKGDYIEAIVRYRAAVSSGGKLPIVDKAKEKLEELDARIIKE